MERALDREEQEAVGWECEFPIPKLLLPNVTQKR